MNITALRHRWHMACVALLSLHWKLNLHKLNFQICQLLNARNYWHENGQKIKIFGISRMQSWDIKYQKYQHLATKSWSKSWLGMSDHLNDNIENRQNWQTKAVLIISQNTWGPTRKGCCPNSSVCSVCQWYFSQTLATRWNTSLLWLKTNGLHKIQLPLL